MIARHPSRFTFGNRGEISERNFIQPVFPMKDEAMVSAKPNQHLCEFFGEGLIIYAKDLDGRTGGV